MNSPQAVNWKEAINEDLSSLQNNEIWNLVPLSEKNKVVETKWVFKIKYLPNRKFDKYKATFCAKGFSQMEGVDFSETFSPTSTFHT